MIVDVNVNVSRWPFRRLPDDEPDQLAAKLASHKVVRAWTGSFDALLHRDMAAVNARLADTCRQAGHNLLIPFGSVNVALPDWKEDLRRCSEVHLMPGIRLFPNYHGYRLDDPAVAELLDLARQRRLIVQIAAKMEDERTQHPLLQAPAVDLRPLEQLAAACPELPIVVLNGLRTLDRQDAGRLASAGRVYFDIAMLESVGGVSRLLEAVPLERVLFGSHFPFFYFESALLKLGESELGAFQTAAIQSKNTAELIPVPEQPQAGDSPQDGI